MGDGIDQVCCIAVGPQPDMSLAQRAAARRGRGQPLKRRIVTLGMAFLAVVPLSPLSAAERGIRLEIINNFPVIDVVIDGQAIPVAFDLGGDHTIELTVEALAKIKVRYLREHHTWIDAKGHKLEARKFVIPELRIADVVFRNVEGHEHAEAPDWPKTRAGLGILGVALFTPSHSLELDYKKRTMRIDSTCVGHRVDFDPKWNDEPVSKARTDIGDLTFVWDTGAPMSFIQAALTEKMDGGLTAQGYAVTRTFELAQQGLWSPRVAGDDFRSTRRRGRIHRVRLLCSP